ncbi:MAG: sialidase family protein [Vicinamibacteria bacterium]
MRSWPDGAQEKLAVFERAGVPSLVRLADRRLMAAFQWFPEQPAEAFDKIAVSFSDDDGVGWSTPATIEIEGLPAGHRFPFDPTLLQLDDGRIRLYATLNEGRTFQDSTPRIGSLLSADGVRYVLEAGDRLAVSGEMVIDCAAVRHRGLFHLYSPVQERSGLGYHGVSSDGLALERQADVFLDGGVRWLGCAVSDGAHVRFYGTGDRGLWSAESEDGFRFGPPAWFTLGGADPGVVEEPDGSRLFLFTGPPRTATSLFRRAPGD